MLTFYVVVEVWSLWPDRTHADQQRMPSVQQVRTVSPSSGSHDRGTGGRRGEKFGS